MPGHPSVPPGQSIVKVGQSHFPLSVQVQEASRTTIQTFPSHGWHKLVHRVPGARRQGASAGSVGTISGHAVPRSDANRESSVL